MQQQQVEKKILAHMLKSRHAVDLVLDNGITEKFFWYKLPHSKKPLYTYLYNMIVEARTKNNSVLSRDVFEDKIKTRLRNKGVNDVDKQVAVLISFYDDIIAENAVDDELPYLIQKIKENWNAKIISQLSQEMKLRKKEADESNVEEPWSYIGGKLLQYLETNLVPIARTSSVKTIDLMRDTDVMITELQNRIKNPHLYQGVYIGLPPIDNATNGFRPGQLIVFIGQVGTGKTTLLTNLAYNACNKYNKNVLFFSLEMAEWMMMSKFNARDASIDYRHLRDGTLDPHERDIIFRRLKERKNAEASFWHKEMLGSCTISDIEREIRSTMLQNKIDIVFVDYLGIVEPSPNFGKQRWEQLGRIAEKLRSIAKEYEIPIVTAVQANRATIKKTRGEMESSNPAEINFGVESVSESITIANTADMIFGIVTDFDENKMWIHQVKNREGNVDTFCVTAQFSMNYIGYDENRQSFNFTYVDNDTFAGEDDDSLVEEFERMDSLEQEEADIDESDMRAFEAFDENEVIIRDGYTPIEDDVMEDSDIDNTDGIKDDNAMEFEDNGEIDLDELESYGLEQTDELDELDELGLNI